MIVELYEDGKTIREIAALTGDKIMTVHRKLREEGVELRPRGTRRQNHDRNAQIYRERRSGMTYRALSEKYDLAVSRIFTICQDEHEKQREAA